MFPSSELKLIITRVIITSAKVVETSVSATKNSPSQNHSDPDEQTTRPKEFLVALELVYMQRTFTADN